MGSFVKDLLLSAKLISEDVTDKLPEVSQVPPTPVIPTPVMNIGSYGTTTPTNVTGSANVTGFNPEQADMIKTKLESILDANKMATPSYLDFVKQLTMMDQMLTGSDERTRFMAAIGALAGNGVSADVVVNTTSYYKNLLSQAKADFDSTINERTKNEVQAKIDEQSSIDATITGLNQRMQELSTQIMDLNKKKIDLGNEAAQNTNTIQVYSSTFTTVIGQINNRIDTHIQKLQGYLNLPTTLTK